MKFRSFILAVCFAVVPAAAPAAGPYWIGAAGGVGVPFGDFSDVASTGFALSGIGDYPFDQHFAVGGELGWQTYGGSDNYEKALSALSGTSVDVTTTTIPILVHGKYIVPMTGNTNVYGKLALGMYHTRVEIKGGPLAGDASSSDFALGLGGGWMMNPGANLRYGVEGMFHFVSTEGSSTNIFLARALIQFGVGG